MQSYPGESKSVLHVNSAGDELNLYYTTIMIPREFQEAHLEPYSPAELVSLMKANKNRQVRFYQSRELAEADINEHSWDKYYREYFVISYRLNSALLHADETSEEFEFGADAAGTISQVPFLKLRDEKDFIRSIKPEQLTYVGRAGLDQNNRYHDLPRSVASVRKPFRTLPDNWTMLNNLKSVIKKAVLQYQQWYESQCCISLSLFHHHGGTGQQRGSKLCADMQKCTTFASALQLLMDHLDRKEGYSQHAGRLHRNSLDSYILKKITASNKLSERLTIPRQCRFPFSEAERIVLRADLLLNRDRLIEEAKAEEIKVQPRQSHEPQESKLGKVALRI